MSNSPTSGANRPHYVVVSRDIKKRGIYAKASDAAAQIKGDPNGMAYMLPSLVLAENFHFEITNGLDVPMIHSLGKYGTLADEGQILYIGRDGLKISRDIYGQDAKRVQDFIRTGKQIL